MTAAGRAQTGCGLDRVRRVSRNDLIAEDVFGLFVEAFRPAVDDPEILAITCRQDREVRTHCVLNERRSTTAAAGLPVDCGHDVPRQGYGSFHFHGRSIRSSRAEVNELAPDLHLDERPRLRGGARGATNPKENPTGDVGVNGTSSTLMTITR